MLIHGFFIYPIVWYNKYMNNTNSLKSFSALLKESIGHFKKIDTQIYKVFGIAFLGMLIFQYLPYFLPSSVDNNIGFISIFILLYFAFMVFNVILTIGFMASLKKKKEVTIKRIINRGKDLLIPFIWVSLIMGMVQIGSFILLIVPFIIISVYLVFAKMALVIDSKKGFDALIHSFDTVRGYWTTTVYKMLLGSILMMISYVVLVFGSLVLMGNSIASDILISFVMTIFIVPLFMIYTYRLYEDIKSQPRVKGKWKTETIINVCAVVGSVAAIISAVFITISS